MIDAHIPITTFMFGFTDFVLVHTLRIIKSNGAYSSNSLINLSNEKELISLALEPRRQLLKESEHMLVISFFNELPICINKYLRTSLCFQQYLAIALGFPLATLFAIGFRDGVNLYRQGCLL